MIVSCPECSAKYNIPDDKITPAGRKVKCKKCAHIWHFIPEDAGLTPQKKAISKKKIAPGKKDLFFKTSLSTIIVTSICLGIFYFLPAKVIAIFPQAKTYYQSIDAIPKDVIPKKIAFSDHHVSFDTTYNKYIVKTILKNMTDKIVKLPMKIEIIGLNTENIPIQDWQFEISSDYLEPNAQIDLTYELNLIKKEVTSVALKLQQM